MGAIHEHERVRFDIPLDAIADISWKDRVVGSLVEVTFVDPGFASRFPGTPEDQVVELAIREPDEAMAEALVQAVNAARP